MTARLIKRPLHEQDSIHVPAMKFAYAQAKRPTLKLRPYLKIDAVGSEERCTVLFSHETPPDSRRLKHNTLKERIKE